MLFKSLKPTLLHNHQYHRSNLLLQVQVRQRIQSKKRIISHLYIASNHADHVTYVDQNFLGPT